MMRTGGITNELLAMLAGGLVLQKQSGKARVVRECITGDAGDGIGLQIQSLGNGRFTNAFLVMLAMKFFAGSM